MGFTALFGEEPKKLSRRERGTTSKLVQIDTGKPPKTPRVTTPRKAKVEPRGCENCTLNEVPGVQKIFGEITGKEILVFAQSPGPEENEQGKALVGKSGQFLWDELKKVGIRRKDCDVQNTVRCFPCDVDEGSYHTSLKMRNPTKPEIKACSIYTDEALEKSTAKHIIVLGKVAQEALLGRSIPKQKVYYSEAHQATLYLLDHPAFFIRGYGVGERLDAFRDTLKILKSKLDSGEEVVDQYDYLRKQEYHLVVNEEQALKAERVLRKYAIKKKRISADIENDVLDEDVPGASGTDEIFCCGFSPRKGLSYIFVRRNAGISQEDGDTVWAVATRILEDKSIKKTLQFGCSDVEKLDKMGVKVQGYDFDTLIGEYFYRPEAKQYGLDAIANTRFQEFSGYKDIIIQELFDEHVRRNPDIKVTPATVNGNATVKRSWLKKHHGYRYGRLSLETTRIYNGADADLTKRVEVDLKKRPEINHTLMQIYIQLNYVLYAMQPNGPLFDWQQQKKLAILYPYKAEALLKKIHEMVGDPEFKPGSPQQVSKYIYETLELEFPFDGKKNVQKKTLLMLSKQHAFPKLLLDWRKASKAMSTYVVGQQVCASLNNGRLRTTWKATGTRTGRLSSGGKKEDPGVINLQNLHGDPQMQNMCVSDRRWRKAYKNILRIIRARGGKIIVQPDETLRSKKGYYTIQWTQGDKQKEVETAIERWVKKHCPNLRTFLILDYGQVEVRAAAQLSGDKNLLQDCMDADIHTTVGVNMTGWKADKIKNDKQTRTLTKNVHFGILFGISKNNLFDFIMAMTPPPKNAEEEAEREANPITREKVGEMYDRYFARYQGVAQFIKDQRAFAKEHSYVETLFGLRQPLDLTGEKVEATHQDDDEEFDADEFDLATAVTSGKRGAYWGNQAINGPVQGTSHQVLAMALINLWRQPKKYNVLGIPVMDVHDALYLRPKVLELVEAYKKTRYLMEHESLNTIKTDYPEVNWHVPIVTEAEAGLRLGTKVPLNEGFTIGGYLLNWVLKAKHQIYLLDKELLQVAQAA